MNCVNHPDAPVTAYCQNCGKALCTNCVRSVAGVIYCEQCLAARLGIGAASGGTATGAQTTYPPGVIAPRGPSPGTAFALGFIPGVGAMYNGQFIKGMVHVLVFVILCSIAGHHDIFGIFVFAWIAYQVFDAYQTAKARRDGLPLPDPFGLNDLGTKLGIPMSGPTTAQGFTATQVPPVPPPPGTGVPPAAGFTPVAGFVADPYAPYSAVPPPVPPLRRHEPVGALILIGLGVLFLLNTLDVFHFDWIGRLWPLLIIAFGAMLFIRRTRGVPPPPPPNPGGQQ
jgi:Domain of unknown function (DUF5668)/B-box zinc finger